MTEKEFVEELLIQDSELACVKELAEKFREMVKQREEEKFAGWIESDEAGGNKELSGFADGLSRDYRAVAAAMRSSWSNGQTEGQINWLKSLKRQM